MEMIFLKVNFRYDYNNKLLFVCLGLIGIFTALSIFWFKHIIVLLFASITILSIFVLVFIIYPQGLWFNFKMNKLIIVDNALYHTFKISDIRKISFNEIKKEKRSAFKGFFFEYYHPSTYMSGCDYVYNNGKVYNITIHLKNGLTFNTYFGWMYKERKKSKIMKIESKLNNILEIINQQL